MLQTFNVKRNDNNDIDKLKEYLEEQGSLENVSYLCDDMIDSFVVRTIDGLMNIMLCYVDQIRVEDKYLAILYRDSKVLNVELKNSALDIFGNPIVDTRSLTRIKIDELWDRYCSLFGVCYSLDDFTIAEEDMLNLISRSIEENQDYLSKFALRSEED